MVLYSVDLQIGDLVLDSGCWLLDTGCTALYVCVCTGSLYVCPSHLVSCPATLNLHLDLDRDLNMSDWYLYKGSVSIWVYLLAVQYSTVQYRVHIYGEILLHDSLLVSE